MRTFGRLLTLVSIVMLVATAASAEVLYQNDFGTTEQFDALTWSSSSGLELNTGLGNPPGDLDGDGFYAGVRCTSSFTNWRYGNKPIFAPPFTVLNNPTVSGYGAGHPSHSAAAAWYLSLNAGTTLDYGTLTDASNSWKQYTTQAAAHSDPAYTNISKFYAATGLKHYSGGAYNPVYTGRIGALQAQADISQPSGGDIVNLTLNDFGTEDQRDAWTATGAPVSFVDVPTYDHDGDDLGGRIDFVWGSGYSSALVLRIDAPAGMFFKDPVASGYGYGNWGSWGTRTYLAISDDGTSWNTADSSDAGWKLLVADGTANPAFAYLSTIYVRVSMSAFNNGWLPKFYGLEVTAEMLPRELPPNTIYSNDFGTTEQITVGSGSDWDSQDIISGTGTLDYYASGWNAISADWDNDGSHGALAANGATQLRYIKHIQAPAGQMYENLKLTVNGHGNVAANSSFAAGLSTDGTNWVRTLSSNADYAEYPDNGLVIDVDTDPNFTQVDSFYLMVEWNNTTAVTDPAQAAYITDVLLQGDQSAKAVLNASDMLYYASSGQYNFDAGIQQVHIGDESYLTVEDRQAFWDRVRAAHIANRPIFAAIYFDGEQTMPDLKEKLERLLSYADGVTTYPGDLIGICFDEEETPWPQANVKISDPMHNELYDYVKANWPMVQVYRWYTYAVKPLSFAGGVAEKCDGYVWDDYYNKTATGFRRAVMAYLVTGKPFIDIIWACEPGWGGYFEEDLIDGVPEEDQNYMVTASPNSSLEQYWWNASDILREFGLPVGIFGVTGSGSTWNWVYGSSCPNHDYIKSNLVYPTQLEMRQSDGQALPSADYSQGDGMLVNTGAAYSYTDNFKTAGTNLGLKTIYDADIKGFTKLVQMPDVNGKLVSRSDSAGQIELVYRFYADTGALTSPSASLTGQVDPAQGGVNTLALSYNGLDITDSVQSTPASSALETLTINGGAAYQNRQAFYVHVIMAFDASDADSPANALTTLNVTATHDTQATAIPDPGKCGDLAYLTADITGNQGDLTDSDCYVDLRDFALVAEQWMECTDPANANCD